MKLFQFLPSLLLASLLVGCADQSAETYESEEAAAEETAAEEAAADSAPGTILSISHAVEDYTAWREVYDASMQMQTDAGVRQAFVLQSVDDPNMVHVFAMFDDSGAAHAFADDPALHEAMQEAGVHGPPSVSVLSAIDMRDVEPASNNRLFVTHEVADFDHWRGAFEEHHEARMEAGLTLLGMGIDENNHNLVGMMFHVADIDTAQTFLSSPEMASVMEEAGVTSTPTLLFLTDVTQAADPE